MSEEKVLFELRVTQDEQGIHTEVTESPEWETYHANRRPRPFFAPMIRRALFGSRYSKQELNRALESLQGIYDDVYGQHAESEV
jgi:hypothetical protein